MSGAQPPVSARDFKKILTHLGFSRRSQTGSHEQWDGFYEGRRRLVTVDCPNAPFCEPLLGYMLKQLGIKKKKFYELLATL